MSCRSRRQRWIAVDSAIVLFVAAAALLLVVRLVADAASAEVTENAPFFRYLSSAESRPALIAFNPSRFDPRKPYPIDSTAVADIRADLAALATGFDGLVLYAFQPELTPTILETAKGLGYRAAVIGLWNPADVREVEGVAETVKRFHRHLALAVVIGNEGLIENRYTIQDVEQAARRLQALSPPGAAIPLSTSEPIGEYGIAGLRAFGDFLAPNIHPAIDHEGTDPVAAAEWVKRRARTLATVAGKPVLVKETGLPNGGARAYSPDAQRQFWQSYLSNGVLEKIGRPGGVWASFAVAFEAFDHPWKAEKTGLPIEGHWGLLSVDRQPYPAFALWRR